MPTEQLALLRIFQLVSPSFPTGGFGYSQGLEWAVEKGWVHDMATMESWLSSLLQTTFAELEIPLLHRLYQAATTRDFTAFSSWCAATLACRESRELRDEEQSRGQALVRLLRSLGLETDPEWLACAKTSQLAGYAIAFAANKIPLEMALMGYIWSWLDNMVMNGVKLIPLGQTQGQQILASLHPICKQAVQKGITIPDDEIAGSAPAFAIACCRHETQYTRLYRS